MRQVTIRPGRPGDVEAVFAMLDGALRWLVTGGRSGQWGSEPFSADPGRIAQLRGWAAGGGRKMIEAYEAEGSAANPMLPYGLTLKHKHLPEMTLYARLEQAPLGAPLPSPW